MDDEQPSFPSEEPVEASANKTLFPGQQSGERVFLLIRKHWFNYVIFFFVDLLALVPIGIMLYYLYSTSDIAPLTQIGLIAGLASFMLAIMGLQLYGFVDYYLDVYIVTSQRVVDISQDGLFNRNISELHLHQVQDVSASVDGMFETLLHFGDVMIQTAGEHENFVFKSVPHPYRIAKQIIDLHEQQINQDKEVPDGSDPGSGYSYDRLEPRAGGFAASSQPTVADNSVPAPQVSPVSSSNNDMVAPPNSNEPL